MHIIELMLKNFKFFDYTIILFKSGFHVAGPNGSSKNTIIDALGFSSTSIKWLRVDKTTNFVNKSSKETTDHLPIYPVSYSSKITGIDKKVYDFIVRRFLATLYIDAKTENISATNIAIAVCSVLNKHCQLITKSKLTAMIEEIGVVASSK